MKDFMIFVAAVVVAVVVWKLLTKKLSSMGHAAWKVRVAGAATSAFAFLFTLGALLPSPPASTEKVVDKAGAVAEAEQAAPEAKKLGVSTSQLLDEVSFVKREASTPVKGVEREMIQVSDLVHIEAYGDKDNLSHYSIMFGLPSDSPKLAVETGMHVSKILANTFPKWRGENDNPVAWMTASLLQLGKNIKANKDEPAPINYVKDGKTITLKSMPSIGLMFLSVEPA